MNERTDLYEPVHSIGFPLLLVLDEALRDTIVMLWRSKGKPQFCVGTQLGGVEGLADHRAQVWRKFAENLDDRLWSIAPGPIFSADVVAPVQSHGVGQLRD